MMIVADLDGNADAIEDAVIGAWELPVGTASRATVTLEQA